MTAEQFTYWLQGFFEINDPTTLGVRETQIIKDHLALVFNKQTPSRLTTNPGPATQPYPGPFTTSPRWEWDIPKNPYTVTCTDSNPFNDKFDDPNNTLKPGKSINGVYGVSTTSTNKLIC